jgi:hypothetical protein
MKDLAVQLHAPAALVAGLVICFLGQRLVKLTLGLVGFVAGAAGGWAAAGALAPGNTTAALVAILAGGVIVAILCFWLFSLGVFVAAAGAGAVATAAVMRATGQPVQPLLILIVALALGGVALLLKKFMLVLSTAFTGSYLITAAAVHYLSGVKEVHPLWFDKLALKSADHMAYVALGLWVVVGLLGMRFQYRGKKGKAASAEKKSE